MSSSQWGFKDRLTLEASFTKQKEHLSSTSKQRIYTRVVGQYQGTQVGPCKEKNS